MRIWLSCKTNRIEWVDCAKSFAIFFVVLLHAGLPAPFRSFVRMFLIPVFFFMSGFFAKVNTEISYSYFLKNKIRTIVFPYIYFNIINYLFWLLIGRHYGIGTDQDMAFWRPILGMLYGNAPMLTHCVPLWFLSCLFVVENVYFICFRHIKKVSYKLLLLVVFAVLGYVVYKFQTFLLPWGINAAMSMILFYGAGNIIKDLSWLEKLGTIKKTVLFGVMICSFIIMWIVQSFQQGETKVFINQYGNYVCFFVGACVGIIFFCAFAIICTGGIKRFPWLFHIFSYIGQNTLAILCLHLMAGSFIKAVTVFIFDLPLSIYANIWVMFLYSILSVILLLPVIAFINRYAPFCLGRSYEKNPS